MILLLSFLSFRLRARSVASASMSVVVARGRCARARQKSPRGDLGCTDEVSTENDRDDDRDERTDDGGRDDDDDDEDDEDDEDASSTRGSHSNGLLETRARGDDEDDARRG